MVILQRNHQALHRAEWQERRRQDQRQPQQRVQPERRLVLELDHERAADHDESGDENYEDRRPITRVGKTVVQAAGLAAWPQIEKALVQPALAAARTAAG